MYEFWTPDSTELQFVLRLAMCNFCRLLDFCRSPQIGENVGVWAGSEFDITHTEVFTKNFLPVFFLLIKLKIFRIRNVGTGTS